MIIFTGSGKYMKKNSKQKYDRLKPDGKAYEELVSDYEQEQMSDYSFKSNSQAMGKNAKKLRRIKIIRAVLSVIGAIIVIYLGYFIVAVIKGVNSRPESTTAQYVEIIEEESTTVPASEETTQTSSLGQAQAQAGD